MSLPAAPPSQLLPSATYKGKDERFYVELEGVLGVNQIITTEIDIQQTTKLATVGGTVQIGSAINPAELITNGPAGFNQGLTVTAGGAKIEAGGVEVTAGGVTVTAGGVLASSGNITATTGNIVASQGDITATFGTIRATGGDIVANAGNIISQNGFVKAEGNVRSENGNLIAVNGLVDSELGFFTPAQRNTLPYSYSVPGGAYGSCTNCFSIQYDKFVKVWGTGVPDTFNGLGVGVPPGCPVPAYVVSAQSCAFASIPPTGPYFTSYDTNNVGGVTGKIAIFYAYTFQPVVLPSGQTVMNYTAVSLLEGASLINFEVTFVLP